VNQKWEESQGTRNCPDAPKALSQLLSESVPLQVAAN